MVYNGYYKVMSNIPKMGQLPTPAKSVLKFSPEIISVLEKPSHLLRWCFPKNFVGAPSQFPASRLENMIWDHDGPCTTNTNSHH